MADANAIADWLMPPRQCEWVVDERGVTFRWKDYREHQS
jgi:hypothetical protein